MRGPTTPSGIAPVYPTLHTFDDNTREAHTIRVDRELKSTDVLDRDTRRQDGQHRARVNFGNRILRKLQRPFLPRTSERENLLLLARNP